MDGYERRRYVRNNVVLGHELSCIDPLFPSSQHTIKCLVTLVFPVLDL